MAGAYLTIGAKFRPFSYDELMKPIAVAQEMHNTIDTQYAELQAKAGVWENLANKETDPESYEKYKSYSDAIRAQAEELAKNGLNQNSMRDMLNLRARYSSDIVPLEQAYTRRRQLADEQRKLSVTNPTLKFQRDLSSTSLDDFVRDPELDYGYTVNGADVAKRASDAFSHLAKSIMTEPEYTPILNGYYFQSMLKSGYSPEQIVAMAKDRDDAPEALKAISQQIYDSTGVEDFIAKNYNDPSSEEAQEWRDYVNSYINEGAWSAVGTTSYGTVANQQKAFENQLRMLRERAGLSGSGGKKKKGSSVAGMGIVDRNDRQLIGNSNKDSKHYLGTMNIAGETHANQLVIDAIKNAYQSGDIDLFTSLDEETGELKSTATKRKALGLKESDALDKMKFSNIQVDYSSGNMMAIGTDPDGNTIRIKIPDDALDIGDSAAKQSAVNKYNEVMRAIRGESDNLTYFKDDSGVEWVTNGTKEGTHRVKSYLEKLKDEIYLAAHSFLEYDAAMNVNSDTGAKRSAALNPNGVIIEDEDDVPDMIFGD